MRSYWLRNGPPLHIAVQVIGYVLGIDWKTGGGKEEASAPPPRNAPAQSLPRPGQTIAEIAAAAPQPGADLTQASADILRQMGIG